MTDIIKSTEVPYSWIRRELVLEKTIKRGDRNKFVKYVQEWLCYHGFLLEIDQVFGAATQIQVSNFQKSNGLNESGEVDEVTYTLLTKPMLLALTPRTEIYNSFGETVLAYAQQHANLHPLEIGGQNRGPWVRMYMSGSEGEDYPWCAGFVTFLMNQAKDNSTFSMPIRGSWSCDSLAAQAKEKNIFVSERNLDLNTIPAGSIFLCRRTSTDWTHTGLVTNFDREVFSTIEGNTNGEMHRDGFRACWHVRAYKNKDFIKIV